MTSVETDIPSIDDVDNRPLPPEHPDEFLTLEELFNMTQIRELRLPTLVLLSARFPQKQVTEAMIGFDLMTDLHFGRKRRTGADEATHPALVGLIDLFANPDLTIDQLMTDYLHDAIEDCADLGITARHVSDLLTLRNFPKFRAGTISTGVEGLTRDNPGDQEAYMHKIAMYDKLVPSLRLRERKLVDTTHTVLSYNREVRTNQSTPAKAKTYVDRKAAPILALGNPKAPNTLMLQRAIVGFNDDLALHNEQTHAATRLVTSPHTLFTARVRV